MMTTEQIGELARHFKIDEASIKLPFRWSAIRWSFISMRKNFWLRRQEHS